MVTEKDDIQGLGAPGAFYHFAFEAGNEVARRHLEELSHGLKHVAVDCGFGSADTMRRAFLRTLRVAPIVYHGRFKTAVA